MDEPQKHNADFRIPDVKVHIFWLYLCPFTLVVLNLFSLFFSNLSTLHLGVFIFIFILLSVPLHFVDLCDGIFFVNFRNVCHYFFKYFYLTLSRVSFCKSDTMRLFHITLQISYPMFLLLFIFLFSCLNTFL